MNRLRLARHSRHRERGFTLIELAASLGLFAIAMVSLSLLFDRAVSATGLARFDQVAKTVAQQKLEEVRSLPYFVPQTEGPGDVDVLDRYFPGTADLQTTATGAVGTYDASTGVWSYTSTDTVAHDSGAVVTRTVMLQFVRVAPAGQLVVVAPAIGYSSDDPSLDRPPSDSVKVVVTAQWESGTGPRAVSLDTLVTGFDKEVPSVEASGSVIGALVTGVRFQEDEVAADVRATAGEAAVAFREVGGSTAQASATAVEVAERHPVTNVDVQPVLPTAGSSAATAPNSTSGSTQATSAALPAGDMFSAADPAVLLASWGAVDTAASTQARVSGTHSQNPEGSSQVSAVGFVLRARDPGQQDSHRVIELAAVAGSVTQASTLTQASVTSTVDLTPTETAPAVRVWTAPQFEGDQAFQGVVTVESMHVEVQSVAGQTTSSTHTVWEVRNLRVWDPDQAAYTGPYTFGFDSDCGGWVDDPALCGPSRTDGKEVFDNPNPVLIPQAYGGTDAQGNPATSLQIVAGVTVRDSLADAAQGVSSATAAQKNILAIATRDDIVGAAALEPMLVGLGDANTSVSYVHHEH